MDLFSKLEKSLFVDNYSNYLMDLLRNKEQICDQCNSEKWEKLFEKIEEWQKRYLMSTKSIEIYGVDGWYVDLICNQFDCSTHMEENIEEYVTIILLIDWILLFNGDEDEYKCYKNSDFVETLQIEFDYSKEECSRLSKSQLLNELQDIYNRSYARFRYYEEEESNNQERIAQIKAQYAEYNNQISLLNTTLHNCNIMRLNSFGGDKCVWYFIRSESTIYSIIINQSI